MDKKQLKKEITEIIKDSYEVDINDSIDVLQAINSLEENNLTQTPYGVKLKKRLEEILAENYERKCIICGKEADIVCSSCTATINKAVGYVPPKRESVEDEENRIEKVPTQSEEEQGENALTPQDNQTLRYCDKCGKLISKKALKCVHCGFSYDLIRKCIDCGSKLSKSDTICPVCGCPVDVEKDAKEVKNKQGKKGRVPFKIDFAKIRQLFIKQRNTVLISAAAIIIIGIILFIATRAKVEKIDITDESIRIVEGDSVQLTYVIIPDKASGKRVHWMSSDDTVATIDRDGIVKTTAPGYCTITVESGKKTDEISVTVISLYTSYFENGNYEEAYKCAQNDEEKEDARQKLLSEYIDSLDYENAYEIALTDDEKNEIRKKLIKKYLEEINYERAYEIAETTEEKEAIVLENIIAFESAYAAENLKDRSSFSLREAYINNDWDELVMEVSGKNGFGGIVTNYWYMKQNEEGEWEVYCTVSSLEYDEFRSWDDTSDMVEKMMYNFARDSIKGIKENGKKFDRDGVNRINAMFKEGTLSDVRLINPESQA